MKSALGVKAGDTQVARSVKRGREHEAGDQRSPLQFKEAASMKLATKGRPYD